MDQFSKEHLESMKQRRDFLKMVRGYCASVQNDRRIQGAAKDKLVETIGRYNYESDAELLRLGIEIEALENYLGS